MQLIGTVLTLQPVGGVATLEAVCQGAAGEQLRITAGGGAQESGERIAGTAAGAQQRFEAEGSAVADPLQTAHDAPDDAAIGVGTQPLAQQGKGQLALQPRHAVGPGLLPHGLQQRGQIHLDGEQQVEVAADRREAAFHLLHRHGQEERVGGRDVEGLPHQPFQRQQAPVGPLIAAAAGEPGLGGTSPAEQERLDQGPALGRAGTAPLLHEGRERAIGPGTHHLMKTRHRAHAGEIRQCGDRGRHGQLR